MWSRIYHIVRKELTQLLRNRRTRRAILFPPLFQLIIYGYAVNLDVDHVRTAWLDDDRTPASRELLEAFSASERFQLTRIAHNGADAQQLVDTGEVVAVIHVLPGFARDLERRTSSAIQVLVDGTNSNTASLVESYANEIVGDFQRSATEGSAGGNRLPKIDIRSRVWFNPELRSRNYFVPGVITNLLMVVTVMLTAMAIVREREIGTMEQLMVTPIRPIELILGKTLPFAAIGLMDVIMFASLAVLIFDVPFRGSFWLLLLCAVLFLMTSLGVGLFISTIARTQQQALMSSFFFATPAFMLSGFAYPIRSMPEVVQYLTYLNPLRYFVEIVRGIFLKGVGVSILWPQMLALGFYGLTILWLSAARFRTRLED